MVIAYKVTFQSTLPLRGATEAELASVTDLPISIHAPLTGSDVAFTKRRDWHPISIHAPLTGSDI